MASFKGITFNGKDLPYFVKVTGIKHRILPTISQTLLTVEGRAGAYDFGNTIGTREIEVDIMIIIPEPNVLPLYISYLTEWLYYDEAKRLVLGDNPSKYYFAKVTGDTDITEAFVVGTGTITFLCTDPYIYGKDRHYVWDEYDGSVLEVENAGSAKVYPKISMRATEDLTSLTIVSDDEMIDFGKPYTVDDSDSEIIDYKRYLINETLNNLNGWSTAPNLVGGGNITGEFEVYGNHCFRQKDLDFGSGSSWHGASMVKTLSEPAQDFSAKFSFRINDASTSEFIGSIKVTTSSLNLYDTPTSTGKIVGKLKLNQTIGVYARYDNWYQVNGRYYCSSSSSYSKFTSNKALDSLMGKIQFVLLDENGDPVVESVIEDAWETANAIKTTQTLINGSSSRKLTNTGVGFFSDCMGYFEFSRKGNVWTTSMYFTGRDVNEKIYSTIGIDTSESFTQPISRLQISTLAYGSYRAAYMELWDVMVTSDDTVITHETDTPIIIRKYDVISIDCSKGTIAKMGLPFYQFLNPDSSFISLKPGMNGLSIYPAHVENVVVDYTEREL